MSGFNALCWVIAIVIGGYALLWLLGGIMDYYIKIVNAKTNHRKEQLEKILSKLNEHAVVHLDTKTVTVMLEIDDDELRSRGYFNYKDPDKIFQRAAEKLICH